ESPLQRGAQVAEIRDEHSFILRARSGPDAGSKTLQSARHMLAVTSRDLEVLAAFYELLPCVGPCGVEEPIVHCSCPVRCPEGFFPQSGHRLGQLGGNEVLPDDAQYRFQRKGTDEDGQAT